MIRNLYAIFDTCSGVYDGPAPGTNDETMIRSFTDLAVNADHPIGKHPEHYNLIKVGSWNDATGEIVDFQNMTLRTGLEAVSSMQRVDSAKLVEFEKSDEVVNYGGSD